MASLALPLLCLSLSLYRRMDCTEWSTQNGAGGFFFFIDKQGGRERVNVWATGLFLWSLQE
jgi:hypothetical protein